MATPLDSSLTGANRDAVAALTQILANAGLGSLAALVVKMVRQGLDSASIAIELQATKEWKVRFAGNEVRRAAGLPELDVKSYLDTETAMKQVARQYGLPKGFYDQPSDFAKLIGVDVSPQEFQQRLEDRRQVVTSSNATAYFQTHFGVSEGDMIAYWTDPAKAATLLEQTSKAAQIGGIASQTGFGDLATADAMRLAAEGVTNEQARQGLGAAGQMEELRHALPGQQEDELTSDQLVGGLLENKAEGLNAIRSAQERRKGAFQGGGQAAANKEGFVGLGPANR